MCQIPPETCPLVLRTVDEIREHHVANVVDDRINGSDRAMALRVSYTKVLQVVWCSQFHHWVM